MMVKKLFWFLIISFIFLPNVLFAEVVFTEIMYNPDGTDSGYEWVEIKNLSGGVDINMHGWRFCEGKTKTTCHTLKDEDNQNFKLNANSFGIITDDREKFLEQNDFSGLVLQSTGFSLLNTEGEKLELKNSGGTIVAAVAYNPDSGGDNGNSLCLIGDTWKDCENTAGRENKIATDNHNDGNESKSIVIPNTYMEFTDVVNGKKRVKAEIDEFPVAVAGARASFSGRAYGLTDNEIHEAEYFWTMGDGTKEYGKEIFHEYLFPGEYIISLTTKVGHFTGTHKRKIKVIAPLVDFDDIDFDKNAIGIVNKSSEILNLGQWVIMVDGEKFIIPEDTYIQGNGKIIFANEIMGFYDFDENSKIFLLLPNEEKVLKYSKKNKIKKEGATGVDIKHIRTKKDNNKKGLSVNITNLLPNTKIKILGIEVQQNTEKTQKKSNSQTDFKPTDKTQSANIFSAFNKGDFDNIKSIVLSKKSFFWSNFFYILFLVFLSFLIGVVFIIRNNSIDVKSKTNKMEINNLIEEIKITEINR